MSFSSLRSSSSSSATTTKNQNHTTTGSITSNNPMNAAQLSPSPKSSNTTTDTGTTTGSSTVIISTIDDMLRNDDNDDDEENDLEELVVDHDNHDDDVDDNNEQPPPPPHFDSMTPTTTSTTMEPSIPTTMTENDNNESQPNNSVVQQQQQQHEKVKGEGEMIAELKMEEDTTTMNNNNNNYNDNSHIDCTTNVNHDDDDDGNNNQNEIQVMNLTQDLVSTTTNILYHQQQEKEQEEEDITKHRNNNQCRRSTGNVIWNILRILICDIPLIGLFLSFLLITILQRIYQIYYIPLIYRAQRTNTQLLQEYTYYDRQCTSYDISTQNIHDLLVDVVTDDDDNNNKRSNHIQKQESIIVQRAVTQMLRHGVIVIPQLLSNNTTTLLRQYIVDKNTKITSAEKYPVSQGKNRLSYGIDATEHTIVSTALQEIVYHPYVGPILTTLLGDIDPASAEITAIMNYYGAPHQVWHQDTKQDGNAIKFARTYSHSYSIFISLQDITAKMGPTDICPGTQYCTNDMETTCERHKIGLHQVTMMKNRTVTSTGRNNNNNNDDDDEKVAAVDDAVFPAGYGAILNQHVWHRGGAHIDEDALERIIFIVSFVARPFITLDDHRQLSRGTYFHQKWNMWGHTLQDLQDPMRYMTYPFSILRCLSMYNNHHHWGYDLITATYMRFANGQLEDEDLVERFIPNLLRYGLPSYLHGRILGNDENDDDDVPITQMKLWTTFIQETIQNIYNVVLQMNIYAHGIYLGLVLLVAIILSIWNRSIYQLYVVTIRYGMQRIIHTHGIAGMICLLVWFISVYSSEWCTNVRTGRILQRPFRDYNNTVTNSPLTTAIQRSNPLSYEENSTIPTLYIPFGIQRTVPMRYEATTVPTRYDILIGTRYDAPFLGSYNQWLQYHPGNQIYDRIIDQYRSTFQKLYYNTPINETTVVAPMRFIIVQILRDVQRETMYQGRWLQQNWMTGDWHINTEVDHIVLSDLKISINHPIRRQINHQIAHHRFGTYRDTKMSQLHHLQLYRLRQQLLYVNATTTTNTRMNIDPMSVVVPTTSSCCTTVQKRNNDCPSTIKRDGQLDSTKSPRRSASIIQTPPRYSNINTRAEMATIQPDINVGTLIWYSYYDSDDWWIPGIVMKVYQPQVNEITTMSYDISVDDGSLYYNILPEELDLYRSVTAGDMVYGCFASELNDCYSGTILHVYVSGNIRILYDDGDTYDHVPPSKYYVPPYRYEGPYQS